MDKSKFAKIALGIFWIHTALSILAIFLTTTQITHKAFQFGFNMGGFLLIVYPIIGGLIYIVVSIIGMIKSKKLLPYLICPVISFIVWLFVGGAMAVYM